MQHITDIAVGQELPSIEAPEITHTQLIKYAGASGDFNPIHTVVPIAEKAGLGDVISHGMLIMGLTGRAITKWFPRKSLRRFGVRFTAMTRPGERIIVKGRVVKEIESGNEKRLLCEVVAHNEAGETKLKGDFEVAR